jgi:cell division protein FtsW (lipid II flippase)
MRQNSPSVFWRAILFVVVATLLSLALPLLGSIQLIHVIAASMWVGSHLILATGPMIRALRLRDSRPILEFYRVIAWPATVGLLIAALTGLYMAFLRAPPSEWFSFGEPSGRIGEKTVTFIVLLVISGYAHARIFPGMRQNNPSVFWRAILFVVVATLLSLALPLLGSIMRYGF